MSESSDDQFLEMTKVSYDESKYVKFTWLNINVRLVSLKIITVFYPMDSICSIHQRCSREKLFLKILQYSQKITCVGVSF